MRGFELDTDALRRGVAVSLATTVPFALLYWGFPDNRGVLAVFTVIVLGGLVAGSALAAMRQQVGLPLAHGLVSALTVFGVLQVVRLVRLVASDNDIRWNAVLSNLLLSIIAGTVGGLVGTRVTLRRTRHQESP
ncbi:MAG TPA: hypothetical protein VF855_02640 [Acidimicrobiales bacterium]